MGGTKGKNLMFSMRYGHNIHLNLKSLKIEIINAIAFGGFSGGYA